MTRTQVATVLGVVASLVVLATAAVALTSYSPWDVVEPSASPEPEPLVVRDRASGARFAVPGEAWSLTGPRTRIYYANDQGRPAAVVRGAAVFRAGYCAARARGSNRGFAGFTRQPFSAWAVSLATGGGAVPDGEVSHRTVQLADGRPARLTTVRMSIRGDGPCVAPGLAVDMVEAADGGRTIRLVLVRDTATGGTLTDGQALAVLTSLHLPRP